MFERYSSGARHLVALAEHEARARGHLAVDSLHVLLAAVRTAEAVRLLESLDVNPVEVRALAEEAASRAAPQAASARRRLRRRRARNGGPSMPLTASASTVFELASRESGGIDGGGVRVSHIVVGLALEPGGVAADILAGAGAEAGRLRELARTPRPADPLPATLPELRDEIERVRTAKEEAIETREFERAASYRDRERKLTLKAHELRGGRDPWWEYRVVDIAPGSILDPDRLDALGADGWEFAAGLAERLVLKRRGRF